MRVTVGYFVMLFLNVKDVRDTTGESYPTQSAQLEKSQKLPTPSTAASQKEAQVEKLRSMARKNLGTAQFDQVCL